MAFANTNGGTVYVGVSATRKGVPIGVEGAEEAIATLKVEIQRKIVPPLDVNVDVLESQGRPVLRVMAPEGKEKPYCLDDNKIYVRQEAETSMAVRDEIVQLVRVTLRDQLRAEIMAEATASKTTPAKPPRRKAKAASETTAAALVTEPAPLPAPADLPPPAPEIEAHADDEADESGTMVLDLPGPEDGSLRPPLVGVEILEIESGRGSTSYVIKDLRNGGIIRNVTPKSARKLWSYAIAQHETNPVQPEQVQWVGDIGLWQASKRAGKMRYDLVQRAGHAIHVYYGVTEDGMSGPWRQFLQENGGKEVSA